MLPHSLVDDVHYPDVINNPGNDSQMVNVFHLYVRDGLGLIHSAFTAISLKITPD
jgi:hypothetical protein